MSIKNFFHETEKGLIEVAYMLYANNTYPLEEALSTIKKTAPPSEMDFNFNVFDMDSADEKPTPEQIINTLNTVSFFGKRRYVIVKNFQKVSGKDFKKFQAYVLRPSPDAVLIMLNTGAIKKEIIGNMQGIKIFCLDIRKKDLPLWIKEKAREKGLVIKDEAVEYLIGTIGTDMGLLSQEIEKLTLLGSEQININSIRKVVEGNRDYGVFDLTQALREKNAEHVFKIYRALSETMEPQGLLGAINWEYSRMMGQATTSQRDYYQKAFELLNDADIRIKTSGGIYPMEYLIVRLLKL
ncbi:MAG: DNA polymerase III subunit delta [Nitrospirae bacterium]|nr:DNA polymerase III subunit delta [Nitrospirota bacterium]